MRRYLIATIMTLCAAASAHAAEPAQTAFDLLSKYSSETKSADYIKLQSSISRADAKTLDAKFSEIYGAPTVTRAGLKVWEVDNPAATYDQAKFTTIMCGPDGDGGIYISADRRGPNSGNSFRSTTVKAPQKINLPPQRVRNARALRSSEAD